MVNKFAIVATRQPASTRITYFSVLAQKTTLTETSKDGRPAETVRDYENTQSALRAANGMLEQF